MLLNRKFWIVFSSALTLFGIVGASQIFIHGEHAMGTSNYVPWGSLIAGYVFFVVSSTGLSLVSSLGHVFKIKQFEVIAKRAVLGSIITLIVGFMVIAIELGNPLNMIYILFTPNFQSGIFWMGLLYGLYLVLLVAEFYFLIKNDHKRSRLFGMLVLISAIVAHSNLGAVFGFLVARSYWHGPYLSIYFIMSALLSGSALLAVMFYLFAKVNKTEILETNHVHVVTSLGKLLALFLATTIFFIAWKMLSGLYGQVPGKYEAIMAIIKGPLSFNFWVFEVAIGMLIPTIILITKGGFQPKRVFSAALLVIVGIFFMRLDLVAAGQIIPVEVVSGAVEATYRSIKVSWKEAAVLLGGIGGTILLYLLGEKLFNLNMGQREERKVVHSESIAKQLHQA